MDFDAHLQAVAERKEHYRRSLTPPPPFRPEPQPVQPRAYQMPAPPPPQRQDTLLPGWADLGGAVASGLIGDRLALRGGLYGRAAGALYARPLEAVGGLLSRVKPRSGIGLSAQATGRLLSWLGRGAGKAAPYFQTRQGMAHAGGFAAYAGYQALKNYAQARYEGDGHAKAVSKGVAAGGLNLAAVPAAGLAGAYGATRLLPSVSRPVFEGAKWAGFGSAAAPVEMAGEALIQGRPVEGLGTTALLGAGFGGLLGGGATKLMQHLNLRRGYPEYEPPERLIRPRQPFVEKPPPDVVYPHQRVGLDAAQPDLERPERMVAMEAAQGDPNALEQIKAAAGKMPDVMNMADGGAPGAVSASVARLDLDDAGKVSVAMELREPVRWIEDPETRALLNRKGILTPPRPLPGEDGVDFMDRLAAAAHRREQLQGRMLEDADLAHLRDDEVASLTERLRNAGNLDESALLVRRLQERGVPDEELDEILQNSLKPTARASQDPVEPSKEVDEVVRQLDANPGMPLSRLNVRPIADRFDVPEPVARDHVAFQINLSRARDPVMRGNQPIVHIPGIGDSRMRAGPKTATGVLAAVKQAAPYGSVFEAAKGTPQHIKGRLTKGGVASVRDQQDVYATLKLTVRQLFMIRNAARVGTPWNAKLAREQEALLKGFDAIVDNPVARREMEKLAPLPSQEAFRQGRITQAELQADGFSEFVSAWVMNAETLTPGPRAPRAAPAAAREGELAFPPPEGREMRPVAPEAFKVFQRAFDGDLVTAEGRKFRNRWRTARVRGHMYLAQGEHQLTGVSRAQGDVPRPLQDRVRDAFQPQGNLSVYGKLMNTFLAQDHSLIELGNLAGDPTLALRGFQYRMSGNVANEAFERGVPTGIDRTTGLPSYGGARLARFQEIAHGGLPPGPKARERANALAWYATLRRFEHQRLRLLQAERAGNEQKAKFLRNRIRDYDVAFLRKQERKLHELGISVKDREEALEVLRKTFQDLAKFRWRHGAISRVELENALGDEDIYYAPIRRVLVDNVRDDKDIMAKTLMQSAVRFPRVNWKGGYQEFANPYNAIIKTFENEIRSAYWGARSQGVLQTIKRLNDMASEKGNFTLNGPFSRLVATPAADAASLMADGMISPERLAQVQDALRPEGLKLGLQNGNPVAVPLAAEDADPEILRMVIAELGTETSMIPVPGQRRSIDLDTLMLDYSGSGTNKGVYRFIDMDPDSPTHGKEIYLEVSDELIRRALRYVEHDDMPDRVRQLAAGRRIFQSLVTRFPQFIFKNAVGDPINAQLHSFATHNADGSVRKGAWVPFEHLMGATRAGWNMHGHAVAKKAAESPAAYEAATALEKFGKRASELARKTAQKADRPFKWSTDPEIQRYLEELDRMGGGSLSFFHSDSPFTSMSALQQDVDARLGTLSWWKDTLFRGLKAWDDYASIFERATRADEYIKLRKAGYRPDQAFWGSGRISLDFWDKGADVWSHGFRLTMPFMGSGMAAMTQNLEIAMDEIVHGRRLLGRPGQGPPRQANEPREAAAYGVPWDKIPDADRRQVILSKAMMFAALGAMDWAFSHRNEQEANAYAALRNDERYEWLRVPGVNVRLPAGFDFARLFTALPKMIMDAHLDEDGAPSAFQAGLWFLGKMNPLTTPVGWGTPLALYANKNFANIPVETYWEKRLPEDYRYRPSTPWLWKELGAKVPGVSPLQMQSIMGSMGYLARTIADFTEWIGWDQEKWGPRPFSGIFRNTIFPSFQKEGRYPAPGLTHYYAAAHQVRAAQSALSKAKKEAKYGRTELGERLRDDPDHKALLSLYPLVRAVDRKMQQGRAASLKIAHDPTLTRAEKESRMLAVQREMERTAQEAIRRMRPVLGEE